MLFHRKMIHLYSLIKQHRMTSLITPQSPSRQVNFLKEAKVSELFQHEQQPQILELGFGLGINFIKTWTAWRQTNLHGKLHYVAIEQYPQNTEQLRQYWKQQPDCAEYSEALINQWPPATPGIHLLHWLKPNVTVTLFFGEILDGLKQLQLAAHGVYLNDFSSSNKSKVWSQDEILLLSRQCQWGCYLATERMTESLKKTFEHNGFLVHLAQGIMGTKGEIEVVFEGIPKAPFQRLNTNRRNPILYRQQNPIKERHALIIGAGIAGCFTAYHLVQSGWRVSLIERHEKPASEASSNPCAVIRPHLALDNSPLSSLTRYGFFDVLNTLKHLDKPLSYQNTGLLWLCDSKALQEHHQRLLRHTVYPSSLLEWVSSEEVFERFAIPHSYGGIYTAFGGNIHVPTLCQTLMQACAPERLQFIQEDIGAATYQDKQWSVFTQTEIKITQAPVLIMASGMNAPIKGLPELPMTPYRGQLLCLNSYPLSPNFPSISARGYATLNQNKLWIGATFQNTMEQGYRIQDQQELLSWLSQKNISVSPIPERHWVGVRATTQDRLPKIGCVDHQKSLYALMGLGSRGLTLSSLGARYLTSLLNGTPSPLIKNLATHLSPHMN